MKKRDVQFWFILVLPNWLEIKFVMDYNLGKKINASPYVKEGKRGRKRGTTYVFK